VISVELSIRSIFALPRPEDASRDPLSGRNAKHLIFELRLCPSNDEISAFGIWQ
jgi:hypothetical protein